MLERVRRASLGVASLAAMLGGCGSARSVSLVAPPGVDWVALITEAGGELHATGLVRIEGRAQLESADVSPDAAIVRAIGYSDATVSGLAPPSHEALAASPLHPSAPCEPALPAPEWEVVVSPDDASALPALPPLTAAWRKSSCAELDEHSVEADPQCGELYCATTVRRNGCRLELDLRSCGLGELVGMLDPSGGICFAPINAPGSTADCRSAPVDDQPRGQDLPSGWAAIDCADKRPITGRPAERCRIDLHRGPFPAAFTVATIKPREVPLRVPATVQPGIVRQLESSIGWIWDLAVLERQVVIAADDEPGGGVNLGCSRSRSTRLYFHDAETLDLVATSSGPPCLRRIVADPEGDGFVGIYGKPPSFTIARYDLTGRRTLSRPITLIPSEAEDERVVVDLLALETPPVLLAVVTRHPQLGEQSDYLLTFRPSDLLQLGTTTIADSRILGVAAAGPGRLLLGDDISDRVVWFRVSERSAAAESAVLLRELVAVETGAVAYDPALGTSLVAVQGAAPGVVALNGGDRAFRTIYYEQPLAIPLSITPWPKHRGVAVVGLVSVPERGPPETYAARFDVDRRRFLPGATPLGPGGIGRVRAGGDGRIWIVHPWSGTVSRLTPAR